MAKFQPNQGGRPRGARNRLTVRVFEDVLAHWNEPAIAGGNMSKGLEALETLFREKPGEYVRAVLSILPRELQIESVMSELSDHDLDEVMDKIKEALSAARSEAEAEQDGAAATSH